MGRDRAGPVPGHRETRRRKGRRANADNKMSEKRMAKRVNAARTRTWSECQLEGRLLSGPESVFGLQLILNSSLFLILFISLSLYLSRWFPRYVATRVHHTVLHIHLYRTYSWSR